MTASRRVGGSSGRNAALFLIVVRRTTVASEGVIACGLAAVAADACRLVVVEEVLCINFVTLLERMIFRTFLSRGRC